MRNACFPYRMKHEMERMIHQTQRGSSSVNDTQHKTHASGGLSHTIKLKAFEDYVYKATGFGEKAVMQVCNIHPIFQDSYRGVKLKYFPKSLICCYLDNVIFLFLNKGLVMLCGCMRPAYSGVCFEHIHS